MSYRTIYQLRVRSGLVTALTSTYVVWGREEEKEEEAKEPNNKIQNSCSNESVNSAVLPIKNKILKIRKGKNE